MKKKNLKTLSLKKEMISNLKSQSINGGGTSGVHTCQTTVLFEDCITSLDFPCQGSFGTEFTRNNWGDCLPKR